MTLKKINSEMENNVSIDKTNLLQAGAIRSFIKKDIPLYVFDEVTSTNDVLKQMCLQDAKEDTLIIANAQTAGRGRFQRSFYSPKDSGIYMSFLHLVPKGDLQAFLKMTIWTAVAIQRVLAQKYQRETTIKWVNDIYYQDKKICGILCEALPLCDQAQIGMIIGIGINVSTTLFPEEIKHKAASLQLNQMDRNQMIADVFTACKAIQKENQHDVMKEYRAASCILHKDISFTQNGLTYQGYVKDIDDDGHLIVTCNHQDMVLSSGEVSIIKYCEKQPR